MNFTLILRLALISLHRSSEAFPNMLVLSRNICIKSTSVSAASAESEYRNLRWKDWDYRSGNYGKKAGSVLDRFLKIKSTKVVKKSDRWGKERYQYSSSFPCKFYSTAFTSCSAYIYCSAFTYCHRKNYLSYYLLLYLIIIFEITCYYLCKLDVPCHIQQNNQSIPAEMAKIKYKRRRLRQERILR